jgi:hypothetical protein
MMTTTAPEPHPTERFGKLRSGMTVAAIPRSYTVRSWSVFMACAE